MSAATSSRMVFPSRGQPEPLCQRGFAEDVSLVLETADGATRIDGETVFSTHDIHHSDNTFSVRELKKENPNFPALQQAGVRYRWDGEETYGMLDCSNPIDTIDLGGLHGR